MTAEAIVRTAQAHQAMLLAVRGRAATAVAGVWDRVVTGPGDDVLAAFVSTAAPLVEAAQAAAAQAAVGFVGSAVAAAGQRPGPVPPELSDVGQFLAPRGVSTSEVLARSVVQVRADLAAGRTYTQAVAAGRARAVQAAATDTMLSARSASVAAMDAEPRIVGYRRVNDGDACPFCVLVSTQRYRKDELMPMHPGCGCTVAPIVARVDPGQVLDRGLVDRLMAADPALGRRGRENRQAAREAAARRLERARDEVTVHQHGELGPTLYRSGVSFDAA